MRSVSRGTDLCFDVSLMEMNPHRQVVVAQFDEETLELLQEFVESDLRFRTSLC